MAIGGEAISFSIATMAIFLRDCRVARFGLLLAMTLLL
jgi:hypothetical protein